MFRAEQKIKSNSPLPNFVTRRVKKIYEDDADFIQ